MTSSGEPFTLMDGVLADREAQLAGHFLKHLERRIQEEIPRRDFYFRTIGMGLSESKKLVTQSELVHPYFLKIGTDSIIKKESGNYNRASVKLPPLHIPPMETVISSDNPKFYSPVTEGYALLAFKYISGGVKEKPPRTLFEMFSEYDEYRIIQLVDDIYQVTFRDMHNFAKRGKIVKDFEHFRHRPELFRDQNNPTLSANVDRYNELLQSAKTAALPHGLVHGDLHAENIIISQAGHPVIIDFEMLRLEGCLINDFAEFEVSLLMAALDADVNKYAPIARRCYRYQGFFNIIGVDVFSQAARAIRANLTHLLFEIGKFEYSESVIAHISHIYRMLLLRYLCSYMLVALKGMDEKRSLVICGVMTQIFDQIHEITRLEKWA